MGNVPCLITLSHCQWLQGSSILWELEVAGHIVSRVKKQREMSVREKGYMSHRGRAEEAGLKSLPALFGDRYNGISHTPTTQYDLMQIYDFNISHGHL